MMYNLSVPGQKHHTGAGTLFVAPAAFVIQIAQTTSSEPHHVCLGGNRLRVARPWPPV
jgi:hypothetical protein